MRGAFSLTAALVLACAAQSPISSVAQSIALAHKRIEYAVITPGRATAAELIHAKLSGVEVWVVADHESETLMPLRVAGVNVLIAKVRQEFLRIDEKMVLAGGKMLTAKADVSRYGTVFADLLVSAKRTEMSRHLRRAQK